LFSHGVVGNPVFVQLSPSAWEPSFGNGVVAGPPIIDPRFPTLSEKFDRGNQSPDELEARAFLAWREILPAVARCASTDLGYIYCR
jgi:hypothetical protein